MFASSRLEREYERTNMVHIIKDSLIERYGLMTMIALGEIISSLYDFIKSRSIGTDSFNSLFV